MPIAQEVRKIVGGGLVGAAIAAASFFGGRATVENIPVDIKRILPL